MAAVAVTEPDFGSDVAGLKVTATPAAGPDGADGYVINGVKTWCTFGARANVLMLLARTDPDKSHGPPRPQPVHRAQAASATGTASSSRRKQSRPTAERRVGKLEGRPIDTIGYRGMHSYEVALEDWWVPAENLIGGDDGPRPRLLPADGGLRERPTADGRPRHRRDAGRVRRGPRLRPQPQGVRLEHHRLPAHAEPSSAAWPCSSRPPASRAYHVATLMAKGQGATEASMVKAYVCKAAEWVTREAMQIHGGMGYAEEFPVSRLFVDARVLSIFEGADETLCLKVIARRLVG